MLPFIEGSTTAKAWNFQYAVARHRGRRTPPVTGNAALANMDAEGTLLPDPAHPDSPGHRRRDDVAGAPRGRRAAPTTADAWVVMRLSNHMVQPDPPDHAPRRRRQTRSRRRARPGNPGPYAVAGDTELRRHYALHEKGFGIFGQVNQSTSYGQIRDGLSNTIIAGELQRITTVVTAAPYNASSGPDLSHDGWAIGGDATLFTTGVPYPLTHLTNPLMNNGIFLVAWQRAFQRGELRLGRRFGAVPEHHVGQHDLLFAGQHGRQGARLTARIVSPRNPRNIVHLGGS